MASVKMLKTAAGPLGTFIVGQIVNVPDDVALAWAECGSCVLLDEPKVVEVATRPLAENAALRVTPPTKKRRGV